MLFIYLFGRYYSYATIIYYCSSESVTGPAGVHLVGDHLGHHREALGHMRVRILPQERHNLIGGDAAGEAASHGRHREGAHVQVGEAIVRPAVNSQCGVVSSQRGAVSSHAPLVRPLRTDAIENPLSLGIRIRLLSHKSAQQLLSS
eukprot:8094036-Pyramimonas_sp.AAC.3